MKLTLSNSIKLLFASVYIILGLTLTSCCSSDYIYVKVKKSDLLPDAWELNRDSLIVGGLKICNVAQRFYYKPAFKGGGGHSFLGFTIPPHFVKTEYGGYTAMVRSSTIKLYCIGLLTGVDELNPMKVEFVVTPTSISSAVLN